MAKLISDKDIEKLDIEKLEKYFKELHDRNPKIFEISGRHSNAASREFQEHTMGKSYKINSLDYPGNCFINLRITKKRGK